MSPSRSLNSSVTTSRAWTHSREPCVRFTAPHRSIKLRSRRIWAKQVTYLNGTLTDAIDAGDAAKAIKVARRMLDSKGRAGLQIVNMLQRHYLRIARLEGSGVGDEDQAATLLGINRYPAGKALRVAQRIGAERITAAVHMISVADLDLKGGADYGGKDLNTDLDVTELTVIEILVARLARLTQGARRR